MPVEVKVEEILKGSLGSIPSLLPSVKIQIMGGKISLRFENKKCVENTQQCFALQPQVKFPANNLKFY